MNNRMTWFRFPDLRIAFICIWSMLITEWFSYMKKTGETPFDLIFQLACLYLFISGLWIFISRGLTALLGYLRLSRNLPASILVIICWSVAFCGERGISWLPIILSFLMMILLLVLFEKKVLKPIRISLLAAALSGIFISLLSKGSLLIISSWLNGLFSIVLFLMAIGISHLKFLHPVHKTKKMVVNYYAGSLLLVIGSLLYPNSCPAPFKLPEFKEPDTKGIVLIVLDTLRWDIVRPDDGSPGEFVQTEKILGSQAKLLRLTAPSCSTLPSHATLFTGLPVSIHGAHQARQNDPDPPWYAYRLEDRFTTVAEQLSASGYVSAGISANYAPMSKSFGIAQGFHYYNATRNISYRALSKTFCMRFYPIPFMLDKLPWPLFNYEHVTSYRNAQMIEKEAVSILNRMMPYHYFLFLNIFDMHSPYIPPDYWDLKSKEGSDWIINGEPEEPLGTRFIEGKEEISPERLHFLKLLYQSQARYIDGVLAGFLEKCPLDSTLLIIVSDHGESLGEHSMLKHSSTLYQDQINVPCWVRLPAGFDYDVSKIRSMGFSGIHEMILTYAGLETPHYPDSSVVVSEAFSCKHPRYTHAHRELFIGELSSALKYPWKSIFMSDGSVQLFDLSADPLEKNDVSVQHPEIVKDLHDRLKQYLTSARIDTPESMNQEAELESGDRDALRALGYVQ